MINEQELKIFSRQLILNDFSEKKFKFIQQQNVILIGIGGIGCPIAQYLIATGIKNLTIQFTFILLVKFLKNKRKNF